MRSVISVPFLMLVLSIFAAARPLKQLDAKALRDGSFHGRDNGDENNHKPSAM